MKNPDRFKIVKAVALPGEPGLTVTYGNFWEPDYEVIQSHLTRKEANVVLAACKKTGRGP